MAASEENKFKHLKATTNAERILIEVYKAIALSSGGGGGGDATAANQTTQIGLETSMEALLTSIESLLDGTGGTGRTPALVRSSGIGSVTAGKRMVSIRNLGGANGTVLGTTVQPGEGITFEVRDADTLEAIAYVATGTDFLISSVE